MCGGSTASTVAVRELHLTFDEARLFHSDVLALKTNQPVVPGQ